MTRHIQKKKKVRRSQKWVQVLVNEAFKTLNESLSKELGVKGTLCVKWLSPLKCDNYAEYRGTRSRKENNCAFLDILGVNLDKMPLEKFWPRIGPQWDALGRYGDQYYFLVESKAYPNEMKSKCCAGEKSKKRIKQSLDYTKQEIDVDLENDWINNYYQYSNRLAHLYFLRELNNVPAYLVMIYFLHETEKPTSMEEWNEEIHNVHNKLGIKKGHKLEEYILNVFIDVRELIE